MKNKFLIIAVIILLAAGFAFVFRSPIKHVILPPAPPPDNSYDATVPDKVEATSALLNVPFVSQAPTANWKDPRQQDGCEEASLLMAWLWVNNKSITPTEAEKVIQDMSDFETTHYGNYYDLNAQDTAKLMKDYYGYEKTEVTIDPTLENMKDALRQGKLVIVPANGQKLDNPNFTGAGPLTHMVVIKGFDDAKNEFTTNDPGTRLGNNYKYAYNTLYNAMVNYPSGHHESQAGMPKAMIAVTK